MSALTETLAVHQLRIVELNPEVRYPECSGCDWVGGLVKDHAVHVAAVLATTHTIIELPKHNSVTAHNSKYWHHEGYDWFVEMLPAAPDLGYDEPGIAASDPGWDDEDPGTPEQAREFAAALLAAAASMEGLTQ